MKIETMKIADLIPAEYNPRQDLTPEDPEYQKLKRSIDTFGLVEPIVFNEQTGRVVGGHQRLKVLQQEGWSEVDVSVVDLHDQDEKALNVALNRIEGSWDNFKLKEVLEDLDNGAYDVELTGFDAEEIEELMLQYRDPDEIEEDDFDPDEAEVNPEDAETNPGDVWQLGRHRLMCGDATNRDEILKLLGDEQADMVFTDPPYNVDYEGKTADALKIENDKMEADQFYAFLYDSFVAMFSVLGDGRPIYVCHADSEGRNFRNAFEDAGFLMKQTIIWVKNSIVMGRQDYQWKHEPILYGWKPGAAHKWYGGRKQQTVFEDPVDLGISKEKDHVLLTFSNGNSETVVKVPSYEIVHAGNDRGTSTWRIEKPRRNGEHPTMKPILLCARAIQNSTKEGDVILDPFGGSGSTLIAAEQSGRSCRVMELDPVYCDVIKKRWEEFTGQQAVKIS